MKRFKGAGLAIVLALLLTLVLAEGVAQAQGRSVFGWVVTSRVTVNNASDLQGTLDVGGAATLDSTLSVAGALTLADDLNLTAQSAATVTNGGDVTPSGAYVPLTAAGNVGTSSIVTTSAVAGDIVFFVNTANVTITFTDTGALKLSGNAALGQYDSLTVIFDGTNWVELAQADN